MNAEEINKKMQTEKDSFNRNLNRLQKQIFELKQRHQRTMEYWQRQKEQTKIKKIVEMFECLNIY
jgi:hypothetical protein